MAKEPLEQLRQDGRIHEIYGFSLASAQTWWFRMSPMRRGPSFEEA